MFNSLNPLILKRTFFKNEHIQCFRIKKNKKNGV